MSSPIPEIGERRKFKNADSSVEVVIVKQVVPCDYGPRAYFIFDHKGRSWLCSFVPEPVSK